MKRYAAIFAIVQVMTASVALADDCERKPPLIIDNRAGNINSGDVRFSYESRFEKFSRLAHNFVWCIVADKNNQNISEFRWGDNGKYLKTLIEPGRDASASATDSSSRIHGIRTIQFRRKNRPDW